MSKIHSGAISISVMSFDSRSITWPSSNSCSARSPTRVICNQVKEKLSFSLFASRPLKKNNKKEMFQMAKIKWHDALTNSMFQNKPCVLNYEPLYNNPSYSRILIGSHLWSIREQTHTWRQCSILVFLDILNLNQSQFFAKHSNQSVRFILYRHKITSVPFSCLSNWRNLK